MSDQKPLVADDGPFVPSGEPNSLPAGAVFKANTDTWYNLNVHYNNRSGNPITGLMYPLASNPATSFWDYMVLGTSTDGAGPAKFRVEMMGGNDGWEQWTLDSGNVLSLKATGWVYRSSAYPIGWKIVNNQLFNSNWGGAVGSEWRQAFVPDCIYMGNDLPSFTCELVPAQ